MLLACHSLCYFGTISQLGMLLYHLFCLLLHYSLKQRRRDRKRNILGRYTEGCVMLLVLVSIALYSSAPIMIELDAAVDDLT